MEAQRWFREKFPSQSVVWVMLQLSMHKSPGYTFPFPCSCYFLLGAVPSEVAWTPHTSKPNNALVFAHWDLGAGRLLQFLARWTNSFLQSSAYWYTRTVMLKFTWDIEVLYLPYGFCPTASDSISPALCSCLLFGCGFGYFEERLSIFFLFSVCISAISGIHDYLSLLSVSSGNILYTTAMLALEALVCRLLYLGSALPNSTFIPSRTCSRGMAIVTILGRSTCRQHSSDTLIDHGLKLGTGDRSGGSRVCELSGGTVVLVDTLITSLRTAMVSSGSLALAGSLEGPCCSMEARHLFLRPPSLSFVPPLNVSVSVSLLSADLEITDCLLRAMPATQ
ncbi:hypothetical protein Tco_0527753 [Tanacetum coccineum]